jgi:hypothetical protein
MDGWLLANRTSVVALCCCFTRVAKHHDSLNLTRFMDFSLSF